MDKIYRDIFIRVGLGLYTTEFGSGNFVEVKTENEASRLVISFPEEYSDNDYAKFMDIYYTGSDEVSKLETYGLGTEVFSGTTYRTFIIPRQFTYHETALIQFRAQYIHDTIVEEQETVDPYILTLKFREALKTSGFDDIDTLPEPIYSEVMAFIQANATSGWSGYSGQSGYSGPSGWSSVSGQSGWSGIGTSGQSGQSGISGQSGWSAQSGQSGRSGQSGQSGLSGQSGWSGISGQSGQSGLSGQSGWSGSGGSLGSSGQSGWSGITGQSGRSGQSGWSGLSGQSGWSGITGQSGWSGLSGQSGWSGISGQTGQSGRSGQSGWSAQSGQSGRSGQSGQSGQTGQSGRSGWSGRVGETGPRGVQGYSAQSGWSGISGQSGWSGQAGVFAFNHTIIEGGGAVLLVGHKGYMIIPFNCTVVSWTVVSFDTVGATPLVIDVLRSTYAGFPPGPSPTSSIAGSELPTILAGNRTGQDTDLTTWTTALAAGDILEFEILTTSAVQIVSIEITVTVP